MREHGPGRFAVSVLFTFSAVTRSFFEIRRGFLGAYNYYILLPLNEFSRALRCTRHLSKIPEILCADLSRNPQFDAFCLWVCINSVYVGYRESLVTATMKMCLRNKVWPRARAWLSAWLRWGRVRGGWMHRSSVPEVHFWERWNTRDSCTHNISTLRETAFSIFTRVSHILDSCFMNQCEECEIAFIDSLRTVYVTDV